MVRSVVYITIYVVTVYKFLSSSFSYHLSSSSRLRHTHTPHIVWIDRIIDGNRDTTSAGLLEECILDGDDTGKCQRFELALTQLDDLLGVGAKEQY